MEKKENRTLKCRYISSTEWEQVSGSEDNYFDNGVKITVDGQSTYCCSKTIIESIARRLNNGELTFSSKEVIYNGKQIEYIFEDKFNNITTKIEIPTSLEYDPRYMFINKDIRTLDTLCNITKKERNLRLFRSGMKKVGAAAIAATTLALSYAGTRKLITTLSEHPDPEHLTYNLYYGNIMAEEQFNENVQRLYESHQRQKEREQQKELSKRK